MIPLRPVPIPGKSWIFTGEHSDRVLARKREPAKRESRAGEVLLRTGDEQNRRFMVVKHMRIDFSANGPGLPPLAALSSSAAVSGMCGCSHCAFATNETAEDPGADSIEPSAKVAASSASKRADASATRAPASSPSESGAPAKASTPASICERACSESAAVSHYSHPGMSPNRASGAESAANDSPAQAGRSEISSKTPDVSCIDVNSAV